MIDDSLVLEIDNNTIIEIETTHDEISASVSEEINVDVSVCESESIELRIVEQQGSAPPYTGSYTFTPSQSAQTININGMIATQDITINPIPNNYGLITWNGSVLTVS